jgi:hypothetical protein
MNAEQLEQSDAVKAKEHELKVRMKIAKGSPSKQAERKLSRATADGGVSNEGCALREGEGMMKAVGDDSGGSTGASEGRGSPVMWNRNNWAERRRVSREMCEGTFCTSSGKTELVGEWWARFAGAGEGLGGGTYDEDCALVDLVKRPRISHDCYRLRLYDENDSFTDEEAVGADAKMGDSYKGVKLAGFMQGKYDIWGARLQFQRVAESELILRNAFAEERTTGKKGSAGDSGAGGGKVVGGVENGQESKSSESEEEEEYVEVLVEDRTELQQEQKKEELPTAQSQQSEQLRRAKQRAEAYGHLLYDATPDGTISKSARARLKAFRQQNSISSVAHARAVEDIGWTIEEYEQGVKESRRLELEEERDSQERALDEVRRKRAAQRAAKEKQWSDRSSPETCTGTQDAAAEEEEKKQRQAALQVMLQPSLRKVGGKPGTEKKAPATVVSTEEPADDSGAPKPPPDKEEPFNMRSIASRRGSRETIGEGASPALATDKQKRKNKKKEKLAQQVERLCAVVQTLGGGAGAVEFQALFAHYEMLQTSGENANLVGLLMQAKKMARLDYRGGTSGMLFQGRHDHVLIRLV